MTKCRPEHDRFFEKIDKRDDGCWIWTAQVDKSTGYGRFSQPGPKRWIWAHRWSYQNHKGPIPEGLVIDHICHTRECVNPDHLRAVTQAQNLQNQSALSSTNKTGYRGVYFCKRTQLYAAQIYLGNKAKFLGRYATAEEAGEVARKARLLTYTHNDLDRVA